jgi:hypothetical protein
MSEIDIQKKGRLAMMREGAMRLKLELDGLRKTLLLTLDELAPIEDLDASIVGSQGLKFSVKHEEYMSLLARIKSAEKALGQ